SNECDEANENCSHKFFEAKRAEKGVVFFRPGGGLEGGASGVLDFAGNLGGLVKVICAEFDGADFVAHTGETLRRGERDEAPVGIEIVEAGIKNSSDSEPACARHHSKRSEAAFWTCECDVISGLQFQVVGQDS